MKNLAICVVLAFFIIVSPALAAINILIHDYFKEIVRLNKLIFKIFKEEILNG